MSEADRIAASLFFGLLLRWAPGLSRPFKSLIRIAEFYAPRSMRLPVKSLH